MERIIAGAHQAVAERPVGRAQGQAEQRDEHCQCERGEEA